MCECDATRWRVQGFNSFKTLLALIVFNYELWCISGPQSVDPRHLSEVKKQLTFPLNHDLESRDALFLKR
jgi:hypothetical protein